jgi:hypothetical protein
LVPEEYEITITVHDQATGTTFEGTPVTFNNETSVTNNLGEAYFKAWQGTFNYAIDKLSYHNISGTVEVNSDTTFHFYLERSSAFVKFKLTEENSTTPVNNATIILGNDTLITTALGIANFRDLAVNTSYSYLIFKGGYNDVTGILYLQTDTTLNIEMISYPTSSFVIDKDGLRIWPNPAQNILYIKIPEKYTEGTIQLFNMEGSRLKSVPIKSKKELQLPVNDIPDGMYILKAECDNQKFNLLIIINHN